eukprot:gnl/MRDRNA2_/MRDRNA2_76486_c0_seq1.p1 gnl/MRDRNA2_/MRDRNA2_76486_c0~~gnl/MRDRNA2_/MRDRNA2_76486_c0_seq1.p1  ORF type:complete len:656 (+),score=102.10 gnl/MRDRNA2_/MRDRNA2_76486_c0_seq1:76-2043(+)
MVDSIQFSPTAALVSVVVVLLGRKAWKFLSSRSRRNVLQTDDAPDIEPSKIIYLTDVEGHWDYFCSFVELANGMWFKEPGNHSTARSWKEIELQDGFHFVFGGDTVDKGPGSLRFLETICKLKEKYPKRVHLILGNRDINKMRWTSELAESELCMSRIPNVPRCFWDPYGNGGKTYYEFIRELAVTELNLEGSAVTEDHIRTYNTKVNKIQYMLHHDMGSAGEFEFRRQELQLMLGRNVSDKEVAQSYEDSVAPGGIMRRYLELAQLCVILGNTLFVHGQIIGNQFKACGENGIAWSVKHVPNEPEPCEDIYLWCQKLNAWACQQIAEWEANPAWSQPPLDSTCEGWRGRGGADLMAYGTPGTPFPSVVYCRWLESSSMPKAYPEDLAEYLVSNGIRQVVVGHTPHGSCPTVIRHDVGLNVIMCDTSYSKMSANTYYKGDNRGDAVSEVILDGVKGTCRVKGRTAEEQIIDYQISCNVNESLTDSFVGRMCPDDGPFFVKARLPATSSQPVPSYLLNHHEGFRVNAKVLSEDEVHGKTTGTRSRDSTHSEAVPPQPKLLLKKSSTLTSTGDSFDLHYIFQRLDKDNDGRVSRRELVSACADSDMREILENSFPSWSIDQMMDEWDVDDSGDITESEFWLMFPTQSPMSRRRSDVL